MMMMVHFLNTRKRRRAREETLGGKDEEGEDI